MFTVTSVNSFIKNKIHWKQFSPILIHTSQNSTYFFLVFEKGIAKREVLKFHMCLTELVRSTLKDKAEEAALISKAEVSITFY